MLTIMIGEVLASGEQINRAEMSVEKTGENEPIGIDFAFRLTPDQYDEYRDADEGVHMNLTTTLEELEAAVEFLKGRLNR